MAKFKRKKTNTKKPDAILTSDWHIREDQPICRTDNVWEEQEKKIDFIFDLANQYQIPIFIGGDIGHKPRWSCKLLEWFIAKIMNSGVKIFVVPGQHDLINHRIDYWHYSGVGVLHAAGAITLLGADDLESSYKFDNFCIHAFPWGEKLQHIKSLDKNKKHIAIIHQMIIENKPLWPGQEAPKGHQLLKQFPEFSIIHSGDNHLPFIVEDNNRKLVNPGNIFRSTASETDHKPRVYLWWVDTNEIQAVYLPIEKDVISREHIKDTTERDNRFDALICRVRSDVEIEMSYSDNVDKYFNKYRTEKAVKDKVLIHVV